MISLANRNVREAGTGGMAKFDLDGHRGCTAECPLLGVKRTLLFHEEMSAYDPKRTCARLAYRHARRRFRNRAAQKLGDATIAPVVHVKFVLRQESAEREAFVRRQ